MLVAKQVADLITFCRLLIGIILGWLGFTRGSGALPWAVWLMLADWTGDSLDGRIARRSRKQYHTWIGDHDLEIDMVVSLGLLVFLLASGLAPVWLGLIYLLAWIIYFVRSGIHRSMGMLFQAPIYAWFIWVSVSWVPNPGWWMVIWIAAAIILTWPQFPQEVIPDFLRGMRK